MMQRRSFIQHLAGLAAFAGLPISSSRASDLRIAVVGGGVAGSRAAAYAKLAMPNANIHLFAPEYAQSERRIYTAIQSGYRPLKQAKLDGMGVNTIPQAVTQVDPVRHIVTLAGKQQFHADVVIMAPGIDFQQPASLHAWQHQGDDVRLWQKIQAMEDGENVVISVPPMPYRFPQGPYRRANQIAAYLLRQKPGSKVIILDSNRQLPQGTQLQASVERFVVSRDEITYSDRGRLVIEGESIPVAVANIIPSQQAARLAGETGLNPGSDWCQVHSETLESRIHRNVFVVGDANDADPANKTAVVADNQAARCVTMVAGNYC